MGIEFLESLCSQLPISTTSNSLLKATSLILTITICRAHTLVEKWLNIYFFPIYQPWPATSTEPLQGQALGRPHTLSSSLNFGLRVYHRGIPESRECMYPRLLRDIPSANPSPCPRLPRKSKHCRISTHIIRITYLCYQAV